MSLKYDTFWAVVGEKTFKYCLCHKYLLNVRLIPIKS